MRFELIELDVWGRGADSWVNNAFSTGHYIDIPDDASDYLINRRLGARGVEWDGDPEFQLFGSNKRNGAPVAQLHRVG